MPRRVVYWDRIRVGATGFATPLLLPKVLAERMRRIGCGPSSVHPVPKLWARGAELPLSPSYTLRRLASRPVAGSWVERGSDGYATRMTRAV